MKLRKVNAPAKSAGTSISKPMSHWTAEKNGGVWDVESDDFSVAVKELAAASEQLDEAKKKLDSAEDEIRSLASRVAEDAHSDIVMRGYGYDVQVKRRTQYRWDSAKLEDIFAQSNNLPSHVKKNLSVERRVFDRLSKSEQDELRSALNIVSQKSAVTLTRSS